jgi:hypothetical protein
MSKFPIRLPGLGVRMIAACLSAYAASRKRGTGSTSARSLFSFSVFPEIALSVGGAVWAVIIGVSTPIAIMAGYCTLVAAVYLGMAPMAYKVLVSVGAGARPVRKPLPPPDYMMWLHVEYLTLEQAARSPAARPCPRRSPIRSPIGPMACPCSSRS